jgi:uncharacterized membrane protein
MSYLLTIIFFGFLISNAYILYSNRNGRAKRKAFRWLLTGFIAFMALYFSITLHDKIFLVVVLPVLAFVLFGLLRFTKFCDWCGRMVRTNMPFRPVNRCPRCGSNIS